MQARQTLKTKAIHIIAMLTKIHVKFEAVIRTLLPLETDHGFDQDQTMGRCPYLKPIASKYSAKLQADCS